MKVIVAIKESKYLIFSYSNKLPVPLTLINSKRKLNSLKKIAYYTEILNTKFDDKIVFNHYRKLAVWLKLISSLFQMLLD
mmetsp:Transcript_27539/g.31700  ORF Transcript_27539/g.31700 Transcript_27539/m.31700 type:complete len:80 (+) Transcript_27539:68-307(+)